MGEPRFRTFLVVWAGQLVSTLGSGLTQFAVAFWLFRETGSATALSAVALAGALPSIVLAPLAGSVIDRVDRRTILIVADTAGAAGTALLAILLFTTGLELWHLVVVAVLAGTANAFQDPALRSAVGLLVPKEHFGRASGMLQTNEALAVVVTPALAGILVATIDLAGVVVVDAITFLIAIASLVIVRFPAVPRVEGEEIAGNHRVWRDTRFAWGYLLERRGLLVLLFSYAMVNLLLSLTNPLYPALVLPFADEPTLGLILSVGGVGMLAGSVVASAWKGPERKVSFIARSFIVAGLVFSVHGLRPNAWLVAAAAALFFFTIPIVNATSQALWLSKVAPGVQGRVFSLRRMLGSIASPLGLAVAGPLADQVFEPALEPGGALSETVGAVVGTGNGRGVAVMYVLAGLGILVVGIVAVASPRLRNLEREVPDAVADAVES